MRRPILWVYAFLAIAGAALPFSQALPWLAANGLDLPRFFRELFSTSLGAFFGLDVIVSACVLVVFSFRERAALFRELWWLPVLCTFTVGVSFGLPVLLLLKEAGPRQIPAVPGKAF
jgi:hypothetical protein